MTLRDGNTDGLREGVSSNLLMSRNNGLRAITPQVGNLMQLLQPRLLRLPLQPFNRKSPELGYLVLTRSHVEAVFPRKCLRAAEERRVPALRIGAGAVGMGLVALLHGTRLCKRKGSAA